MNFKNYLNEDNNPRLKSDIRIIEKYLENLKRALENSASQETVIEEAYFITKYAIELFGDCNVDELSDRYKNGAYKTWIKELKNTFNQSI